MCPAFLPSFLSLFLFPSLAIFFSFQIFLSSCLRCFELLFSSCLVRRFLALFLISFSFHNFFLHSSVLPFLLPYFSSSFITPCTASFHFPFQRHALSILLYFVYSFARMFFWYLSCSCFFLFCFNPIFTFASIQIFFPLCIHSRPSQFIGVLIKISCFFSFVTTFLPWHFLCKLPSSSNIFPRQPVLYINPSAFFPTFSLPPGPSPLVTSLPSSSSSLPSPPTCSSSSSCSPSIYLLACFYCSPLTRLNT